MTAVTVVTVVTEVTVVKVVTVVTKILFFSLKKLLLQKTIVHKKKIKKETLFSQRKIRQLQNSKCDETQNLKLLQNSKMQIVTKLEYDKSQFIKIFLKGSFSKNILTPCKLKHDN